jgi:hypothetical protein
MIDAERLAVGAAQLDHNKQHPARVSWQLT